MASFCRYFEGGVSSVYLWDLDHGFAGVILIKKAGDGSNKIKGCWDSIHVVEVQVSSVWSAAFLDCMTFL
jgi:capping protein beta